MNPRPPRLSMSQVTTYRWSFEDDVLRYAEAGFAAIGVWRRKLADYGLDRAVELLHEANMDVTHLTWAGGFTGSDGRSLDEAITDAKHALRQAAELRAGCLVLYTGGRNNHTFRHAGRLLRMALDELILTADREGVVLALEPMHPACAANWTFLTDVESAVNLVRSYESPWLKLTLDTYHFGHDRSLLANLREVVPHLALVQLADRRRSHRIDNERCLLGNGDVPLGSIIDGLTEAGYDGDFDIELQGLEIELSDYNTLLKDTLGVLNALLQPMVQA